MKRRGKSTGRSCWRIMGMSGRWVSRISWWFGRGVEACMGLGGDLWITLVSLREGEEQAAQFPAGVAVAFEGTADSFPPSCSLCEAALQDQLSLLACGEYGCTSG